MILPPKPPPRPPRFNDTEAATGQRNENVSLMQQLIGLYDDLDEVNRELLVVLGHALLRAQVSRLGR